MTSDSQSKVKLCLFAAVLNFLILALPRVEGSAFYFLVSIGMVLDLAAIWLILRDVKPFMDESEHLRVAVFSKRWIAFLTTFLTIATLVAAVSGKIEKQALPFLVFGYMFLLLLPMKILDLAVEKRMKEIGNGS